MKLLLFDIDGTILHTNGAGTRAANRAFEKIYGHAGAMDGVDAAGKTDPLILREMFVNMLARDYAPDEPEKIYAEYVIYLEEEVRKSPIDIMPGIPRLLENLSSRNDLMLSIATGNIELGARIKLRRAGLDAHFRTGGFGSDSETRKDLISIAIERSKAHLSGGEDFDKVFVIGDTPHDIVHGRAAGAVTVAVATGRYTSAELSEHGPDHIFEHLADYESVIGIFG